MTGQQTVDDIHAQARRQFRDHAVSVMQCEIEMLRAKVLELSESPEPAKRAERTAVEALDG